MNYVYKIKTHDYLNFSIGTDITLVWSVQIYPPLSLTRFPKSIRAQDLFKFIDGHREFVALVFVPESQVSGSSMHKYCNLTRGSCPIFKLSGVYVELRTSR
jgi:hypothetical protein